MKQLHLDNQMRPVLLQARMTTVVYKDCHKLQKQCAKKFCVLIETLLLQTFSAETTNGELSSDADNVEFFRSLFKADGVVATG